MIARCRWAEAEGKAETTAAGPGAAVAGGKTFGGAAADEKAPRREAGPDATSAVGNEALKKAAAETATPAAGPGAQSQGGMSAGGNVALKEAVA